MRVLLVTGLALLMVSYSPLSTILWEWDLRRQLRERYRVEQIGQNGGDLTGRIGEHQVLLQDDAGTSKSSADRASGEVRVLIDGRDFSSRMPVAIRTSHSDGNRYWGFVALRRLIDRERGVERLVVAQRTGSGTYRTTSVDRDGHIPFGTALAGLGLTTLGVAIAVVNRVRRQTVNWLSRA